MWSRSPRQKGLIVSPFLFTLFLALPKHLRIRILHRLQPSLQGIEWTFVTSAFMKLFFSQTRFYQVSSSLVRATPARTAAVSSRPSSNRVRTPRTWTPRRSGSARRARMAAALSLWRSRRFSGTSWSNWRRATWKSNLNWKSPRPYVNHSRFFPLHLHPKNAVRNFFFPFLLKNLRTILLCRGDFYTGSSTETSDFMTFFCVWDLGWDPSESALFSPQLAPTLITNHVQKSAHMRF